MILHTGWRCGIAVYLGGGGGVRGGGWVGWGGGFCFFWGGGVLLDGDWYEWQTVLLLCIR